MNTTRPGYLAFAELLRHLMRSHGSSGQMGWKSEALARALSGQDGVVSASLVRHWLLGDRLPDREKPHVEKIAQVLGLSETEQRQLQDAYERSREARELTTADAQRRSAAAIKAIVSAGAFAPPVQPQPLPKQLALGELPDSVVAVHDEVEIARKAIAMLNKAGKIEAGSNTIYLTYNGSQQFIPPGSVLYKGFTRAVRAALDSGWDVLQLIRLDESQERLVGLVRMVQAYLGSRGGNYVPLYHTNPTGTLKVPDGLCIVPGVGALLLYATTNADRVDAGIYLPDTDVPPRGDAAPGAPKLAGRPEVEVLIKHVRHMREAPGVVAPLVHADMGEIEFNEALAAHEEYAGAVFLVKSGFGLASRPESCLEENSTWYAHLSEAVRERWYQITRRRIDALIRRLDSGGRYRAICPKSAILDFAHYGIPARDDRELWSERRFRPGERWDQLDRVIALLTTYPEQYQLALLDHAEERDLLAYFWEVAGERAVMVEAFLWESEPAGQEETDSMVAGTPPSAQINMEITVPTLVKAFHAYGDELWNQVAPANRDHDTVVAWLIEQRHALERQYPREVAEHRARHGH